MSGQTLTIVTGQDPRGLAAFSEMREEINKASHPAQPVMDWKRVEALALTVFERNGVDLHTATYYTLARTRTQGLAGFCEGTELLAALISREWDSFWPQDEAARREMLDWFNTRTGSILRQQLAFSKADLPLLMRVERALQVICDTIQQAGVKRPPRVENLLYFVQNTRRRHEQPPASMTPEAPVKTAVRTLVYLPEGEAPPAPPESYVPPVQKAKPGSGRVGFALGALCSGAVLALGWWWQVYLPQQRVSTLDRATLAARAANSPQMLGWQQTREDLRAFAELLVEREKAKSGFTLSHIKTVIYEAERTLDREIPLEYLLTQYQQARAAGKSTDLLEKQINERLDGVQSRWQLLTQTPQPDAPGITGNE